MTRGLSNDYLYKTCRKLFGKSFLGVFPCDVHPSVKIKDFSLIFNTGDSSTSGEHFVAIYCEKKVIYYFDSFGEKPNDKNIEIFLAKHRRGKRLTLWKKRIQHSSSSHCGFFCLGYLLSKYKKIRSFPNIFDLNNLQRNDKLIVKFILKHCK